mmetsp:Transcript_89918/g.257134  ORF Transcript_89918/g.257134 Transcript_89918/m.257134 type:complete len:135 (-) Transcript_89918:134-538(-)
MAEQSRYLVTDGATRAYVNSRLRDAIRAPSQAYDVLTDAEVTKLLVKIVEAGAHTTNAAAKAGAQTSDAAARTVLPPFLYNLIASAVDTFGMLGSTAASTAASTASTVASLGSAAGSMVTGAIRNGAATPKKPP